MCWRKKRLTAKKLKTINNHIRKHATFVKHNTNKLINLENSFHSQCLAFIWAMSFPCISHYFLLRLFQYYTIQFLCVLQQKFVFRLTYATFV